LYIAQLGFGQRAVKKVKTETAKKRKSLYFQLVVLKNEKNEKKMTFF